MKKLEIKNKEYFGILTFENHEKRVLEFLKEVDLEQVRLYDAKSACAFTKKGEIYSTVFYFKTEKDEFIQFHYKKNKKVTRIMVRDNLRLDRVIEDKTKYDLIYSLWEQFVDHFNLRIRLMFIDETTPWKWNTKFTY